MTFASLVWFIIINQKLFCHRILIMMFGIEIDNMSTFLIMCTFYRIMKFRDRIEAKIVSESHGILNSQICVKTQNSLINLLQNLMEFLDSAESWNSMTECKMFFSQNMWISKEMFLTIHRNHGKSWNSMRFQRLTMTFIFWKNKSLKKNEFHVWIHGDHMMCASTRTEFHVFQEWIDHDCHCKLKNHIISCKKPIESHEIKFHCVFLICECSNQKMRIIFHFDCISRTHVHWMHVMKCTLNHLKDCECLFSVQESRDSESCWRNVNQMHTKMNDI